MGKVLLNRVVLIVIVLAVNVVFNIICATRADQSYFDSSTWSRWDSFHYESIARSGYSIADTLNSDGHLIGNAAWFPAYSWAQSLFINSSSTQGEYFIVGSILPKLFFIGILILVATLLGFNQVNIRAILVMLLTCFWAGAIFYHANYPISMLVFWILLAIYCFKTELYYGLMVCCFLAAITYSTGFLLGCAIALAFAISEKKWDIKRFVILGLQYVLPSLLGVLLVIYVQKTQTGHWDAFFQVQANYGNGGFNFFLFKWGEQMSNITKSIQRGNHKWIYYIQTVVVVIGYMYFVVKSYKHKWLNTPIDTLVFVIVTTYLIFPWTIGGNLSMYRVESILVPAVFLIDKYIHPKIQWGYLVVLIVISFQINYLFFTNRLM